MNFSGSSCPCEWATVAGVAIARAEGHRFSRSGIPNQWSPCPCVMYMYLRVLVGAVSSIHLIRSVVWVVEIGVSTRIASWVPWMRVQDIGEKALDWPSRWMAMGRREETQTSALRSELMVLYVDGGLFG